MSRTSKYKYVYYRGDYPSRSKPWQGCLKVHGRSWTKMCKTEKQAAIAVDKQLIEMGKEPVNVLKKKVS